MIVAASAAAAGCTVVVGFDDLRFDGSVAGSGAGGSAGTAGAAGACPEGGAGSAEAAYVSPSGDDTSDGLSSTHPLASIGRGIEVAGAACAPEVRVCAGTYVEPSLLLEVPISLLGGFDCTDWTRTREYGHPLFDGVNESVIENAGGDNATLRIAGTGIGRSVLLDGFTVRGRSDGVASPFRSTKASAAATSATTSCSRAGRPLVFYGSQSAPKKAASSASRTTRYGASRISPTCWGARPAVAPWW